MDYSEKDVIDNLLKTNRDLFTALRYFVLDEANRSNRDMTVFFSGCPYQILVHLTGEEKTENLYRMTCWWFQYTHDILGEVNGSFQDSHVIQFHT